MIHSLKGVLNEVCFARLLGEQTKIVLCQEGSAHLLSMVELGQ